MRNRSILAVMFGLVPLRRVDPDFAGPVNVAWPHDVSPAMALLDAMLLQTLQTDRSELVNGQIPYMSFSILNAGLMTPAVSVALPSVWIEI